MNKIPIRKILSLAVGLLSIVIIIWYLLSHPELLKIAVQIKFHYFIILFSLSTLYLYINGIFFKILVKQFGINIKEHFQLSVAGSFLNLIAPLSAGSGLRAVYMKKKYGLTYSSFFCTMLAFYATQFLLLSIGAMIIFPYLYIREHIYNIAVTIIFIVLFIISLVGFLSPHFSLMGNGRITQIYNKYMEKWGTISKSKTLVLKLMILCLISSTILALQFYTAFKSINIELSFTKTWYLVITNSLVWFINFTPAGIGVTEGLTIFSAKIIGFSINYSLVVALILRVANTASLLVYGPIANYQISQYLKSTTRDKEEKTKNELII